MNALYSLYDALISINVPADRAKAVVDAMEHEMAAILATKDDVALLRQEMKGEFALSRQELAHLRQEFGHLQQEFGQLRQEMDSGFAQSRQETDSKFGQLRQEMDNGFAQLRQETDGRFVQLRQEMDNGFAQLRQEIDSRFVQQRQETESGFAQLRQEMNGQFALMARDIRALDEKIDHKVALLRSSMMVWLGSIQVVGLGLLFAALKLT